MTLQLLEGKEGKEGGKEIAVFMHFQPISYCGDSDSLRVHLSKKACYPNRRLRTFY